MYTFKGKLWRHNKAQGTKPRGGCFIHLIVKQFPVKEYAQLMYSY